MGDHALVQDVSFLQAGAGSESVISVFSTSEYDEKWRIAEHKTAELLDGIQPCRPSEGSRMAVINYVEGLIRKNFHCKVFPYGSMALKTYLPDGDIDLTAVNICHGSNSTWAREMCASLEKEEHTHNASGFQVKEVMCIQAKVPVVKCLVGSIIVDISFNQLGGLSKVCFLEEVDRLIGRNHLFKRSIILVKAWCFYESRILGAHHGLLSTYAVETLVLFVLNAFHRSLRGPLEVLFRFLKFFSKFDWNRYCLSAIRGPIPLLSLHKMAGESLQDVSGQLLLTQTFLDACRERYSLCFEGTQGNTFSQKFMNIVDPLRPDNNLGGSINRGSLLRIQRAFAYGAGQLEKLLHSTSTNVHLAERLATFFRNTQKHCRGLRPDAFSSIELCQQVNSASLCDDKASSGSANTEVTAEKVMVEHAQLLPSCNGAQAQRAADFDNDELHQRLKGIKKCMKNENFNKFPKVLDLTASNDDDDTHKAGGTGIFGKDPCSCSLQDLQTSPKRLERRKSDTSSTQTNLCRLLEGSMTHLFLYTTIVASAKGLANCDSSLCDHAFYDILKRKLQSKALSSSIFRVTLSLLPWISSKIEVQQEGNACIAHLGMQLKKNSSHPIIHCKSRSLFPSGSQGSLLQEDQFTRLTKKTEVDILRGDLATYLLNLESARCTPKSCLQDPLLHESRTKKCSLPVEQESALEGPGNPKAVAPPISATNAMPMSDLLAEGSRKPCKGTGAFIPNLMPGLHLDKHRVNTSNTWRKRKLKTRKKEKKLLMEGLAVHGSFLNTPNRKENSNGGFFDTAINKSISSISRSVEMLQFGSLSPGLLAASLQDLPSCTRGASYTCKALC